MDWDQYMNLGNDNYHFISLGEDVELNPFKDSGTLIYAGKNASIDRMGSTMRSNLFPPSKEKSKNRHTVFSRWGIVDPFSRQNVLKEFLFFTKPDLRIFKNRNGELVDELTNVPFFLEMNARYREVLWQLQQTDCWYKSPFMNLLTNTVTSKLDMPDISAETSTTTNNIMGYNISLRGHSLKSDGGSDFNLSFNDYGTTEVYQMAKAYDSYMRLIQTGEVAPFRVYSENNILFDQFSIYKFLVGDDGETILYYAKFTGCYFTNVPRGDFSDPSELGKCSLGFHAQFVEDSKPEILLDFMRTISKATGDKNDVAKVYNAMDGNVNNNMVWMPYIAIATANTGEARSLRRSTYNTQDSYYDYRLKWLASNKKVEVKK